MKTNTVSKRSSRFSFCAPRKTLAIAVMALALAGAVYGQAIPQLGFKMGITNAGQLQSGALGALQPTDLAGAPGLAQTNWMNLGRFGISISPLGGTNFTN